MWNSFLFHYSCIVPYMLFAFELLWVSRVFKRLPKDISEFKTAKLFADRAVILFIWGITLLLVAAAVLHVCVVITAVRMLIQTYL